MNKTKDKQAKLTQAITREYVRQLGGTFKKTEYGDFRLKFGEESYHANDLQDIVETARVMKGSHPNIESADEYLCLMLGHIATEEN
jgi:hypothetical protein